MLAQTIRQQLKGMLFLYVFAAAVFLLLSSFSPLVRSDADFLSIYIQIVGLIWPILSASLLFAKEFQSGALPYLFAAPNVRKQILAKKLWPSLILGLVPFAVTTAVVSVITPGQDHYSMLPYLSIYLTLLFMATIFSFLPSMLTIFSLTVVGSVVLWGFVPFSCFLVSSWQGGYVQLRHLFAGLDFSLGFLSSFGEALLTFGMLSVLPVILLAVWLRGFQKYAEPDHRRSYGKMVSKGGMILTGSAALLFALIYFFLPVDPWGEHHLTREGHLFFHGIRISRLITDQGRFRLRHDQNSEFLAETDRELVLTVAGAGDRIDLIGWSKRDGSSRPICDIPRKPLQKMIFQAPNSVLCLAAKDPREWTEIDLDSGRKTVHPFMPFDVESGKKMCYPIALVSSGDCHMLLISDSDLRYFYTDYGSPLSLYLCRADQAPQALGESLGLPIQLSPSEIVLAMHSRQVLEKYRLADGRFELVESVPFPKIGYWHIVRDFRFWPEQQPLFGFFGQYRERKLLTVRLAPLEATVRPLEQSEIRYFSVSTTPYWSFMSRHDANAKEYVLQRLDRQQAEIRFSDSQEFYYPNPHAYGFLTTDSWPPKWQRIRMPQGKIERMTKW